MGLFGFGSPADTGTAKARTLAFPAGEPLGMVYLREAGAALNAPWKQYGNAEGKLNIPAGQEIMLQVRCETTPDFALFERFAPSEFHTLDLLETKIEDRHLAHIRHLTGIRSLNLSKTGITDAGMGHVAALSELIVLTLYGTRITDAGLAPLKALGQLQTLWVNRTGVTDAGLEHLREIKSLKEIYVADSGITEAGRGKFRQWNPNCYVRTGKGSIWSY